MPARALSSPSCAGHARQDSVGSMAKQGSGIPGESRSSCCCCCLHKLKSCAPAARSAAYGGLALELLCTSRDSSPAAQCRVLQAWASRAAACQVRAPCCLCVVRLVCDRLCQLFESHASPLHIWKLLYNRRADPSADGDSLHGCRPGQAGQQPGAYQVGGHFGPPEQPQVWHGPDTTRQRCKGRSRWPPGVHVLSAGLCVTRLSSAVCTLSIPDWFEHAALQPARTSSRAQCVQVHEGPSRTASVVPAAEVHDEHAEEAAQASEAAHEEQHAAAPGWAARPAAYPAEESPAVAAA